MTIKINRNSSSDCNVCWGQKNIQSAKMHYLRTTYSATRTEGRNEGTKEKICIFQGGLS